MCLLSCFRVSLPTDNLRVYVTEIDKICNGYNPPLIMCVLLNNRVDLYTAIKKSLCVTRASKNYKIKFHLF